MGGGANRAVSPACLCRGRRCREFTNAAALAREAHAERTTARRARGSPQPCPTHPASSRQSGLRSPAARRGAAGGGGRWRTAAFHGQQPDPDSSEHHPARLEPPDRRPGRLPRPTPPDDQHAPPQPIPTSHGVHAPRPARPRAVVRTRWERGARRAPTSAYFSAVIFLSLRSWRRTSRRPRSCSGWRWENMRNTSGVLHAPFTVACRPHEGRRCAEEALLDRRSRVMRCRRVRRARHLNGELDGTELTDERGVAREHLVQGNLELLELLHRLLLGLLILVVVQVLPHLLDVLGGQSGETGDEGGRKLGAAAAEGRGPAVSWGR